MKTADEWVKVWHKDKKTKLSFIDWLVLRLNKALKSRDKARHDADMSNWDGFGGK